MNDFFGELGLLKGRVQGWYYTRRYGSIENYIKHEMLRMLDKEVLENVTGPAIYGMGDGKKNFRVVKRRGEWVLKPKRGYRTPKPRGILNNEE